MLKEVAITIDDGPHEKWAPTILKVLKRNHVHATFFVVGKKVLAHPGLAKAIVAGGHEIGNHSMTHPRLITLDSAGVKSQLEDCATAVKTVTGKTMRLMRPPGLRYSADVLNVGKSLHYITVEENIAVGDFIVVGDHSWYEGSEGFNGHVEQIKHNVFKQLKNGAIIVLHDMPVTAVALDAIIKGIRARGYKIVTIPQMLSRIPNAPAEWRRSSKSARRPGPYRH